MKRTILSANVVIIVLLVLSSLINAGLGRKVQLLQRELQTYANKSSGANVIGMKLTDLNVKDIDGNPTKLDFTQTSTPTLIYVFRPTCGWCAKNLPNIKELDRALHSNGKARIIGVSLDDQGLKQYVQGAQLGFPVYRNVPDSDVVRLNIGGTPQTIMVSNATIVHNWQGAYSGDNLKDIQSTFGVKLPGLP